MNVMEILNSRDAFYFPGCHTVVAAIAGLRWPGPGASVERSDEEPPLLPVHGEEAGIVIDGYLGVYLSAEQRIVIYKKAIAETAARLGIHPEHL